MFYTDTVGRPFCYILAIPFQSYIRWYIFWPDSAMGYSFETLAGAEDTAIGGRPYTPCVRYANGGNTKRTQFDYEQHGWHCL